MVWVAFYSSNSIGKAECQGPPINLKFMLNCAEALTKNSCNLVVIIPSLSEQSLTWALKHLFLATRASLASEISLGPRSNRIEIKKIRYSPRKWEEKFSFDRKVGIKDCMGGIDIWMKSENKTKWYMLTKGQVSHWDQKSKETPC